MYIVLQLSDSLWLFFCTVVLPAVFGLMREADQQRLPPLKAEQELYLVQS